MGDMESKRNKMTDQPLPCIGIFEVRRRKYSCTCSRELPVSRVFLGKAEVRFVCDGMVVSIKVILFHVPKVVEAVYRTVP
jgi:hypothetical protein